MEYINKLIYYTYLLLDCPSCGSHEFQVPNVITEDEALVCHKCNVSKALFKWVTFIKIFGDNDPYVNLAIETKDGGYFLCVDTKERKDNNIETIRFHASLGGGRSPATLEEVRNIASHFKKEGHTTSSFQGQGGILKINPGIDDVWMRTLDINAKGSHGVKVFFPRNHEFVEHIPRLIKAMLLDMKNTFSLKVG